MKDNSLKEFIATRTITFTAKGKFHDYDEFIAEAQKGFDKEFPDAKSSIECKSTVNSVTVTSWELDSVSPIITREGFIQDLIDNGWEEHMENHYIYKDPTGLIEFYYVARKSAYYWNSETPEFTELKFNE